MKRIAFILALLITACAGSPTKIPDVTVKTAATAVHVSDPQAADDASTGDTTGPDQSLPPADLPADSKTPAANRKPDTK